MIEDDKLRLLIKTFEEHSNAEDIYLINRLVEFGFCSEEAEKYIIFLPLAFGRFYLNSKYKDIEFNEFYSVSDSLLKYSLSEDPIYEWSLGFAEKNATETFLSEREYLSILTRSSEIKGILSAISQKKNIDGAKFRTIITLGTYRSKS